MSTSHNKKKDITLPLIILVISVPIFIYLFIQDNKEKNQLKIDPIEINAVISEIKKGHKRGLPTIHYSYHYKGKNYNDSDICSHWYYKYRKDGIKDIHGIDFFSIIGDTFDIIISKSHPEYSDFIEDPIAFKRKYYLNKNK